MVQTWSLSVWTEVGRNPSLYTAEPIVQTFVLNIGHIMQTFVQYRDLKNSNPAPGKNEVACGHLCLCLHGWGYYTAQRKAVILISNFSFQSWMNGSVKTAEINIFVANCLVYANLIFLAAVIVVKILEGEILHNCPVWHSGFLFTFDQSKESGSATVRKHSVYSLLPIGASVRDSTVSWPALVCCLWWLFHLW